MTISVLLVDDDALVRAGLQMILSASPDIEVVGEVDDGAGAVAAVLALRPDVVLMDIRMPVLDGIAATGQLQALDQPPAVVVLTTFAADEYVLDALVAGASGFLVKDTPPQEIIQAVQRVAAGDAMLSPSVTRTVLSHVGDDPARERLQQARELLDRLTEREREVAVAIRSGASNAEIGRELYLSEATVKAHVSRLLTKLDAANRVQVAIIVHDARLD